MSFLPDLVCLCGHSSMKHCCWCRAWAGVAPYPQTDHQVHAEKEQRHKMMQGRAFLLAFNYICIFKLENHKTPYFRCKTLGHHFWTLVFVLKRVMILCGNAKNVVIFKMTPSWQEIEISNRPQQTMPDKAKGLFSVNTNAVVTGNHVIECDPDADNLGSAWKARCFIWDMWSFSTKPLIAISPLLQRFNTDSQWRVGPAGFNQIKN